MANNVDELVQELYKEFRGLPNTNAIVRNNIPNDAFTIVLPKVNLDFFIKANKVV